MKLPEASAGVTCEVCHGMVDIPDITGNGNYVLDKIDNHPALGRQAALKRLKIQLYPKKLLILSIISCFLYSTSISFPWITFKIKNELTSTSRGNSGFGSTGI